MPILDHQLSLLDFFPSPVFLLQKDKTILKQNHLASELIRDIKFLSNPTFGFDPSLCFMAKELNEFYRNEKKEDSAPLSVQTITSTRYFQMKMHKQIEPLEDRQYILVVLSEISDVKKAEELISEYQRMMNTLMANLPGLAYRCQNSKEWTMEFVSNGCIALTGYQPEDLIQNKLLSYNDMILPEDRKYVWLTVQDAIAKKANFELVYRIYDRDGKLKWVWEKGAGVFDKSQNLLALEGFIIDISDRKKIEEIKNEFVNTVSHELRTPLTSLKESLSILTTIPDQDSDTRRSILEIANRNVQRLHRLINGILDFQRMESGRYDFHFTKETPQELINQACEELLPSIQLNHLTLKKPICTDLPKIWVDRDRIIEVLDNLIDNAVKYSEKGSITVRAFEQEKEIVFVVEDQGYGIAQKDFRKLFLSFTRLATSGAKQRGSGLGLAISKKIVQGHNGRIWVESIVGVGSQFYFSIPLRQSDPFERTYSG